MEPVYMWLIFAVVMMIIEIFTPGFFSGSVAVAALCTSVIALIAPEQQIIQWFGFFIMNFVMFAFLRKIAVKYFFKEKKKTETNFSATVGQVVIVSEAIDNDNGTGYVKVYGDVWRAVSLDGIKIKKAEKVRIVKTEGNKVFVVVVE